MVVGAGVALRLWVVTATRGAALFADMVEYHGRALHLYTTGALMPDMFRMPLSAMAYAACMWLSPGDPLFMIRLMHVAAQGVMIAIAFGLGWRVGGRGGALLAGGIVATYPALVLYSVYVMPETLYTLFLLGSVALVSATASPVGAAAAGAAGALANLVRSAGLILLPALPLLSAWTVWSRTRKAGRAAIAALACAAAFVIVMTPWVVRNARHFGEARWTDTSGGVVFLMANNELATGRPEMVHWDVAMKHLEGIGPEGERSAAGYRIGMQILAERPAWAALLTLKKLRHMFALDGREHAWVYSVGYFGERSSRLVAAWGIALMAAFPVVMMAAVLGLRRAGLRDPIVLACAVVGFTGIGMHLLTYGDARYHLPFVPLLAVMGAGVFAARPAGATRRGTVIAGIVLIALAIVWIADLRELLPKLAIVTGPGGAQAAFPY
jgi:4-amino-4-deoxy-L-arabinose transferase-like glycosyltransferase